MAAEATALGVTRKRVLSLAAAGSTIRCELAGASAIVISRFLAGFVQPGDELEFTPTPEVAAGTALRVLRNGRARPRELLQVQIGYAARPKEDKRHEYFLRADVPDCPLGIKAIHIPSAAIRDYFYRADRTRPWDQSPTLYELLAVDTAASPGDLRLAFKIRNLELEARGEPRQPVNDVERAFNLLMEPELRAAYDALLRDSETPAVFPHSGFGSLLVAGELGRDNETFFAQRIVAFLPEHRRFRFRASIRKFDFLQDHAVYRDSHRKLEARVDPALLPVRWDPTWNRWKHLLGARIGIEGTFVRSGVCRFISGQWQLTTRWVALPSRLAIDPPADLATACEHGRCTHEIFGRYSEQIAKIRARIETEPLRTDEAARWAAQLGLPAGFDIVQIAWKPDYDRFHFDQLRRRARAVYMFRDEYIFELDQTIAVEVPAAGHATYLFAKPSDVRSWFAAYSRVSRDDVRRNRWNLGSDLGYLRRLSHSGARTTWLNGLGINS